MKSDPSDWRIQNFDFDSSKDDPILEDSLVHVVVDVLSPLYTLFNYFSSFTKLLNSTVYVLRFTRILPLRDTISKSDLEKAESYLIRAVQQHHFSQEYSAIVQNKPIKSKLSKLNPFVKDGIIRVGGRLSHSKVNFDQRHPILLPKTDPFVKMLIQVFISFIVIVVRICCNLFYNKPTGFYRPEV